MWSLSTIFYLQSDFFLGVDYSRPECSCHGLTWCGACLGVLSSNTFLSPIGRYFTCGFLHAVAIGQECPHPHGFSLGPDVSGICTSCNIFCSRSCHGGFVITGYFSGPGERRDISNDLPPSEPLVHQGEFSVGCLSVCRSGT